MKHLGTPSLALVLLLATLTSGCKKETDTTPPDDTGGGTEDTGGDTGDTGNDDPPPIPAQDPDPAELAANFAAYELGKYDEVQSALAPLVASWTGDTQLRMRAIGSAILALATAEKLAEDAKEPAETALEIAGRLGDEEVEAWAHLANGVYLLGVENAVAAGEALEKAAAVETPAKDTARTLKAEAKLNLAFDADGKIVDKGKLDEAAALYQEVADSAKSDIAKAHALEGLAGAYKYKGDKAKVCEHAKAAAGLYDSTGASDYVKEVPALMMTEVKCKK